MTQDRIRRTAAELANARQRYHDARRSGDTAGAAYARAEAERLRRILEGVSL